MTSEPGPWTDAVKLLGEAAERGLDGPPDPRRLIAYQRGELSPEERREVEERIDASREDARLLLDWQEFSHGTAEAPPAPEMDAAWRRLQRAMGEEQQKPAPVALFPALSRSRRVARSRWAVAASLFLAVLAGGWGLLQKRQLQDSRQIRTQLQKVVLGDSNRSQGPASLPRLFTDNIDLARIEAFPTLRRERYQVSLVSAAGKTWWSGGLQPDSRGALVLYVAKGDYPAGTYQLEVRGEEAGAALERFPLQIAE